MPRRDGKWVRASIFVPGSRNYRERQIYIICYLIPTYRRAARYPSRSRSRLVTIFHVYRTTCLMNRRFNLSLTTSHFAFLSNRRELNLAKHVKIMFNEHGQTMSCDHRHDKIESLSLSHNINTVLSFVIIQWHFSNIHLI